MEFVTIFGVRRLVELWKGINNKIKVIKRQAYGFTNFRHLRM